MPSFNGYNPRGNYCKMTVTKKKDGLYSMYLHKSSPRLLADPKNCKVTARGLTLRGRVIFKPVDKKTLDRLSKYFKGTLKIRKSRKGKKKSRKGKKGKRKSKGKKKSRKGKRKSKGKKKSRKGKKGKRKSKGKKKSRKGKRKSKGKKKSRKGKKGKRKSPKGKGKKKSKKKSRKGKKKAVKKSAKYERCVWKIKQKQPARCFKKGTWTWNGGKGCYNPWAICNKTVGK